MSDKAKALHEAILEREPGKIHAMMSESEFVLLSTHTADEDDDNVGAMTAEIEDVEVLVVFSEEDAAGEFVNDNTELFEEDEEVEGVVVDGTALLDYLPEGYGILLDPKGEEAVLIDPSMVDEIKSANS